MSAPGDICCQDNNDGITDHMIMRHSQTKLMLGCCVLRLNVMSMKYLVNIAVVDGRGSSVAGRGVVIGSDCGGSSGVGGEGSRSVGSDRGGSIGGSWGSN